MDIHHDVQTSFLLPSTSSPTNSFDNAPSSNHLPDVDIDEEDLPFITKKQKKQRPYPSLGYILPWLLVFIFALLFMKERIFKSRISTPLGTFASGFATEFESAFPSISVEKVRFKSGLRFDENNMLYRTFDSEGPQFVGKPNTAIDKAWTLLLGITNIAVTEDEASKVGGGIYREPISGKHVVEIEFLHSLHCLNKVRMALDIDYYYPNGFPEFQRTHVDHCVDILREILQCHADLTPIPIVWSEAGQRMTPDFEQLHTCRNVTSILSWFDTRPSLGGKTRVDIAEEFAVKSRDNGKVREAL